MHRKKLLTLLDQYTPQDHAQQIIKTRIITFVKQYPDCFERTLAIGHITASCWLLSKDENHVLLLHHRKLDKWLQPGGHCDGNPDVLAVAIKEAQEESGIIAIEPIEQGIFDLDIHTIPTNSREGAHDHYDIRFLLKVTSEEQPQVSHESRALRWFCKDEQNLPTNEESVLRMVGKWKNHAPILRESLPSTPNISI